MMRFGLSSESRGTVVGIASRWVMARTRWRCRRSRCAADIKLHTAGWQRVAGFRDKVKVSGTMYCEQHGHG